jgi:hypothetical protein
MRYAVSMRNAHPPCRPFSDQLPVQASWDDGNPGPMEGLFWESPHNRDENGNPQPTTMTPEQIAAAQLLGHTPETWNHGMTQDDAATKIAAAFHGRKQRKKFQMQVSALSHPTQQCTAEPRVAASQPARAIRRKQQGLPATRRRRLLLRHPQPHHQHRQLGNPGCAAVSTGRRSTKSCRNRTRHLRTHRHRRRR